VDDVGTLRYNHTQGILFEFLGNAFLAFFYHAAPRLAERPVISRRLGWWLVGIWNFCVVLPGWILVLAEFGQPLEWAEFPLIVALFVKLPFILSIAQFATPFVKSGFSGLYVSAWYIIGGLVFTTLAYPVGNLAPQLFLSMIGFWLLFFVYPLNGTHHYVFSSIPMDAQKAAIAASAYLGMDVILVVTSSYRCVEAPGR
jgi:cbb3-type cytochrome oxidase subunit 1